VTPTGDGSNRIWKRSRTCGPQTTVACFPRGDLDPAREPSGGEGAPQFGLTVAMALIVGSIIGVGIFNLPTSLAV
jgi:hypothetical protein